MKRRTKPGADHLTSAKRAGVVEKERAYAALQFQIHGWITWTSQQYVLADRGRKPSDGIRAA
jgi:hypothetical protein